jgi:hypothetical protein
VSKGGHYGGHFDCIGMVSDSTTDEQARRRDRRGHQVERPQRSEDERP